MSLRTFADVESMLIDYLHTATGVRAVTDLPELLEAALPVYRVTTTGGGDNRVVDTARVNVESFATTRAVSRDLAEQARSLLLAAAHTVPTGSGVTAWVLDTVETLSRPVWIDYANEHVQRFIATYEITTRVRG